MNALQLLVHEHLRARGQSRGEFIRSLGYSNINKGLRALDAWGSTLQDTSGIGARVQALSGIAPASLDHAIAALQAGLAAQRAQGFRPFIQVVYSARPSPVFAGQPTGYIPVTAAPAGDGLEAEIDRVFALYQAHQLRCCADTEQFLEGIEDYGFLVAVLDQADREQVAYPWVFGNGFCYWRTVDDCLSFDRHGRLLHRGSRRAGRDAAGQDD